MADQAFSEEHPFLDENTPPEDYENLIQNDPSVEVAPNQNPELDEEVI